MGPNQSQEFWHKDEDYPSCEGCDEPFTFTNRRHHCRCCGRIYCGHKCTAFRGIPIDPRTRKPVATKEPVRLCQQCAQSAIAKKICQCRPERLAAAGISIEDDNNNKGKDGGKNKSNLSNLGGGRHGSGLQKRESNLLHNENGNSYDPNNGENGDYDADNQHGNGDGLNGDDLIMTPLEKANKEKIDQLTRELNDNIVDLGPFNTLDYGLHFSENPVYGMRIATVVGPVAYSLPNPDAGNSESVAALLCGDPSAVPQAMLVMTKHALKDFEHVGNNNASSNNA